MLLSTVLSICRCKPSQQMPDRCTCMCTVCSVRRPIANSGNTPDVWECCPRGQSKQIFLSIAVLSVIGRDSAKLPWEFPLLIHSTASAKFMFSTATSLDSVRKLCDIKYFKKKGDFHNICERINENLTNPPSKREQLMGV